MARMIQSFPTKNKSELMRSSIGENSNSNNVTP